MTSKHNSAFSRRDAPELVHVFPPNRGRGECRVPTAPAASRVAKNTRVSHHGRTGTPGIPARNGFNGFLRALPGDRAFLSPSSALLLADLTPASRRQDHTTSPSASARFVKHAARVHRIPLRVRDDRDTPLLGNETAGVVELIWVNRKAKYFCKEGWTANSLICPSGANQWSSVTPGAA